MGFTCSARSACSQICVWAYGPDGLDFWSCLNGEGSALAGIVLLSLALEVLLEGCHRWTWLALGSVGVGPTVVKRRKGVLVGRGLYLLGRFGTDGQMGIDVARRKITVRYIVVTSGERLFSSKGGLAMPRACQILEPGATDQGRSRSAMRQERAVLTIGCNSQPANFMGWRHANT